MSSKSPFDLVLKDITDRYGIGSIMRASDSPALDTVRRIKTGIFDLDLALGGGFPHGRMMTLKGEYSSGKTVIALLVTASFQRHCRHCLKPIYSWDPITGNVEKVPYQTKAGKPANCCRDSEQMRVVWQDAEKSWSNVWAKRWGVDTDRLFVIRTQFAEQGIDVADHVIRSGECDLLVVDSVAALTPSAEVDESSEKWQIGVHARLMNKAMRKWVSGQNKGSLSSIMECSILLINQLRLKVGIIYGNPETSPGGKGIDFHSSIIVKVKKKGYIEFEGGLTGGHMMEIACVKNKTAPPMRTGSFDLAFVRIGDRPPGTTDHARQVLRNAVFWQLVKKKGSFYTLAKGVKVQGEDEAVSTLSRPQFRKILDLLAEKVWEKEVSWLDGDIELAIKKKKDK